MKASILLSTALLTGFTLTACGNIGSGGSLSSASSAGGRTANVDEEGNEVRANPLPSPTLLGPREGIERDADAFDENRLSKLFGKKNDGTTGRANKYLWRASLDVLNFLPVESADPFTGVIVFGYGRAPGGSTSYRATVVMTDPGLDARSLKVAVHTSGGPASAETQRQIENAILNRARQLRIASAKL